MDPKPDVETEHRFPLVAWNPEDPDFDCEKFVVYVKTPGIVPLKRPKEHEAKNGSADVTILKQGMDVKVEVEQTVKPKKKKKTIFRFKVVRFPSPVNRMLSSWRVEKDEIVISLHKKEPIKWMPYISMRGLDQSSSSNSSEEEPSGAAAPKQKKGVLRLNDLAAGVSRLVVIERKSKGSDSSSSDDDILKKYAVSEEFKEM